MATLLPPRSGRDWSSLPELAVFDIAVCLNPIEFLSLAGVCKPWHTTCTQNKTQISTHQFPLLLALKSNLYDLKTPTCEAYSFPDKRLYKRSLPSNFIFPHSRPLGCSHGYILLYVQRRSLNDLLCLVNPFTEDVIEMPLPGPCYVDSAALLTAPPSSPACMVVVFSEYELMVGRPGVDARCSAVDFTEWLQERDSTIRLAVFFKGLVYVVTDDTVVAVEIEFGPEVSVKKFAPFCIEDTVKDLVRYRCPLWLYAGEEELFLVELELKNFPEASKIKRKYLLRDGEGGTWEEVESLGGLNLFAADSSEFVPRGRRVMGLDQRGEDDRVFFISSWCKPFRNLFPRATRKLAWISPSHFV